MRMKASDFRNKCITEKQEQFQCLEILNGLQNFTVWRQNTGASRYKNKDGSERFVKYGKKGMPDLMGYVQITIDQLLAMKRDKIAIPFFFEVKRKRGRLSDDQKLIIEKFNEDGCFGSYGTASDLMKYLASNKLCNWNI